jgi:hypothetical protein
MIKEVLVNLARLLILGEFARVDESMSNDHYRRHVFGHYCPSMDTDQTL